MLTNLGRQLPTLQVFVLQVAHPEGLRTIHFVEEALQQNMMHVVMHSGLDAGRMEQMGF